VNWWGNNIPGNCVMGCAQPDVFMRMIANYSSINYGFTFLTENPDPQQTTCGNSTSNCPVWDGNGIYIAHASQTGATVVTAATTVHDINNSPGLVGMAEVCRLARQGPNGPKRCLITLGGWSDWARMGSIANAQTLATLVGKMVLFTFADGIDLDFEHLTEFSWLGDDEFAAFQALILAIRQELNSISGQWVSTAQARLSDLQAEYNAMPSWQQAQSPYYPTNIQYLQEVQQNGPPYFEISWTTRFNAILNTSDPFNYLAPDSPKPPPFSTDNEGMKFWPAVKDAVDTINIMAYDAGSPAGPLKFDFTKILLNFETFGPVPKTKPNMGFEPGEQNAGGVWEGLQTDIQTAQFIKQNGFGGAMVWAINQNTPQAAVDVPLVAGNAYQIIQPSWPFGNPPVYSKVNPQTGWLNSKSKLVESQN